MKATIPLLTGALMLGTALHTSASMTGETPQFDSPRHGKFVKGHGKHQHGKHGMHRRGGHGDHHDPMKRMLRGLDLTQEQKDKIFEIRHASVPAARDNRNQMRTLRQALRAQTTAENYDAAQVTDLANKIGALQTAMIEQRTATMRAVFDVLTPEQRTQLKEKMARRGQRGERHGKRARRGEQ